MKSILVVEDDFFLAGHIAWLLEEDGFNVVGPVGSLDEARQLARDEELDGALLDVNLHGGRVDEAAEILALRGVPFVFVTAYSRDNLPEKFRDRELVNKPFTDQALMRAVQALGPTSAR
ncbi:MAG: response regulator [Hyphomicrobiales bacterium]|nr:response regulator [Hyphomicrobiales bacterium]